MPEGRSAHVRLEFLLNAPVEAVFEAWSDPEVLAQWFGPSDGIRAEVEVDLRVGGRYRITMGSRTARGIYLEIEPPRRLSFTWVWEDEDPPVETQVTVALAPDGQDTRMVLEHDRLPLEVDCMGFEMGWRRSVERLERLLDDRPGRPQAGSTTSPIKMPS